MKTSYLILDFNRPQEGRILLESLKQFANHDKDIVYLCNGGSSDYAYDFYKEGLIDTLIIKKHGDGGGFGQTDLFRYCRTKYAFFVQVDQRLIREINEDLIKYFVNLLNTHKCVDLNGDQGHGIWSDRSHFIDSEFFNSLAPFPNGGPGNDAIPWNEKYLQEVFISKSYKIAHIQPLFFQDLGKFSVRQAGDGVFIHRCDNKQMWVIKFPSHKTEVYPPLNNSEFDDILAKNWPVWEKDEVGRVPKSWENNIFNFWK